MAKVSRERIERERIERESREAVSRILRRRRYAPVVSDERIRAARLSGRP